MNTDLKTRTKQFALRIIRLFGALPKTVEAQVLGKQLLRSGTSVGAHYREAHRARSNAEFISKIEGGLQEIGGKQLLARAVGGKRYGAGGPSSGVARRSSATHCYSCDLRQTGQGVPIVFSFILHPSSFIL